MLEIFRKELIMRNLHNSTIRYIAGYVLGISIFLILIPYSLWYLSSTGYYFFKIPIILNNYARLIGSTLLFLIGSIFVAWSNIFLLVKGQGGPTDIAGISISPQTKKLVTEGPYKYTRNPMIFGTNSIYISIAIYLNSLGCLIVWIIFFLVIVKYVVPIEEKRLLRDFGAEYIRYKENTSKIIPLPMDRVGVLDGFTRRKR
jgi:protein-S-isoprenylcysteine O-methyltransferase Ste14